MGIRSIRKEKKIKERILIKIKEKKRRIKSISIKV